jgi:GntR family transcriptional regulator
MSHALSELHRWPGHRQVIMAHVPGGTRKAAQRKTAAQRTAASRRPLKYRRIADDLRESIRSGEYAPGGQLPGENELMQRYDVARMTARQALAVLQREGLAVARRGSGVFVSDFRPILREGIKRLSNAPWNQARSIWADESALRDLDIDSLHVAPIEAPAHIAAVLELENPAAVWARSRRFVLDGRPVMLSTAYLPAALVDGSLITQANPGPGGTYARLAELGHAPNRFREEIRARPASPDEAARLNLPHAATVVALTRQAYSGERPVEVNEMVLDAAVYVLRYDFEAGGEEG